MPRTIAVDVVADTTSLTRGFTKATRESQKFAGQVEHGFARVRSSIAFASTALIGGTGLVYAFEKVIGAATDARVAQRSLEAQMKASGESFRASQRVIEQAETGQAKFGFTVEESAKALTVLDRATGDIRKALYLQAGVTDLARAKNIDLADAAAVVGKVFGGQETALRRAVPGLSKTAHGIDLIREAFQKLRGQARAATTPQERFNATLHETEIIIGTALLPTFNKMLGRFSDWLDKMNKSGKLQKDLTTVTEDLSVAFDDLSVSIGAAYDAYKKYSGVTSHLPGFLKVLFQPGYGFNLIMNALKKKPAVAGGNLFATPEQIFNQQPGKEIQFFGHPAEQGPIDWSDTAALGLPKSVSGSVQLAHAAARARLPRLSGSFQFLQGSYAAPAALELQLARATALGQSIRPVLLAMRRAAYRALHSGRLAIQAQTDAWNAIAALNDQLKQGAQKALRRGAISQARAYGAEYQFAYALGGPTIHIEHFYSSASSPRALENELAKRARARAHVRRGQR